MNREQIFEMLKSELIRYCKSIAGWKKKSNRDKYKIVLDEVLFQAWRKHSFETKETSEFIYHAQLDADVTLEILEMIDKGEL